MSDKIYSKEFLKQGLKKCESTPLPFAFGEGSDSSSHKLVIHPTRIGKGLFGAMKKDEGVESGTWGTARFEGSTLVLDCEKKLPGIKKKLKDFVKANKPLPLDTIKVLVDGKEVVEEEEGAEDEKEGEEKKVTPPNTSNPPPKNPLPKTLLDKKATTSEVKSPQLNATQAKLKLLGEQMKDITPKCKEAILASPGKKDYITKLFGNVSSALKSQDPKAMEEAMLLLTGEVLDILDSKNKTGTNKPVSFDRAGLELRVKELMPRVIEARKVQGAELTLLNKLSLEIRTIWLDGKKDQAAFDKTVKVVDQLATETEKILSKPVASNMDADDKDAYEKLLSTLGGDTLFQRYDPGMYGKRLKDISVLASHGNYKQAMELLRPFIPEVQAYFKMADKLNNQFTITDAPTFLEASTVPDNTTTHTAHQKFTTAKNQLVQLVQQKEFGRAGLIYSDVFQAAKALIKLNGKLTGQAGALETNTKLMPDPRTLKLGKQALDTLDRETNRGGLKGHGKYFDKVLKGYREVDKDPSEKHLAHLETAAKEYLQFDADRAAEARKKGKQPEEPDTVTQKKLDACKDALKLVAKLRAHAKYSAQMTQLTANLPPPPAIWPDQTIKQIRELQAKIISECPSEIAKDSAKPPSGKGNSDSFFINGPDGNPMFIYKTREGENVKEGEKEGMGVAREMLSSSFNDLIQQKTGLDFGFAKATFARLDCAGFDNPVCASKATSRSGVLLEAIPNEGSLEEMSKEKPGDMALIPDDDVQKIMLMDFITLQGDRNAENVLIQEDDKGKKRLRPIDGGFAFPSKDLFDKYRFGMPGSSLVNLPAADKPFSKEMQKALDKIDADDLTKGMKKANSELPNELQGLIEDDSVEMMKRSVLFLKEAAKELTPRAVATLYETEFPKILLADPGKVDAAVKLAVKRGKDFLGYDKALSVQLQAYEKLGGDTELRKLGYDFITDPLLKDNISEKMKILKNRTPPGPPPKKTVRPNLDSNAKQKAYDKMGGDNALREGLKRSDTKLPVKDFDKANTAMKYPVLLNLYEFEQFGGDRAFERMVNNWDENRYLLFNQLDSFGKVCRAAFSTCKFSPMQLSLGEKCAALQLLADRG